MATVKLDEARLKKTINIDEAEFLRIIAAIHTARRPRSDLLPRQFPIVPSQKAAAKLLEAAFTKGGLDARQYENLLKKAESERREVLAQRVKAATDPSAAQALRRAVAEERRKAFKLLATPYYYTTIYFDEPFWIWMFPFDLGVLRNITAGELTSSVQFDVFANGGAASYQFVFYFYWINNSDYYAVLDADTAVHFQGSCQVAAASGFFSGSQVVAGLTASLDVIRWIGWGNDPVTGLTLDYTPYPQTGGSLPVSSLYAQGGNFFGSFATDQQIFTGYRPTDWFFPQVNTIVVPTGASVMFEVTVTASYDFESGGGGGGDSVGLEFSSPSGDSVICEYLDLTLLTPAS
jgi:hypothetical protein